MSSHYKEIPTLTSLLRRRGMTLTQWCRENSVTSEAQAVAVCKREGLTFDPSTLALAEVLMKEELRVVVDAVHDRAEMTDPLPKHMREAEDRFGIKITPRTDIVDPVTGEPGSLMYDITVPEAPKGPKKKGRRAAGDTADEGTGDSLAVTEGDSEKKKG